MPINFPSAPALNEEFVHQYAYKYRWDGVKWVPVGLTTPTGSGVVLYDSISDLVFASRAGLSEGYYAANAPLTHPNYPQLVVYWDGTQFAGRQISPLEDFTADMPFWFGMNGALKFNGTVVTANGATANTWDSPLSNRPSASGAGSILSTTELNGSIAVPQAMSFPDSGTLYDTTGFFEVFSTVRLSNNTQSNAGIIGKWSGVNGWLLIGAQASPPYAPGFGFVGGNYAETGSRLDTNPHVIHGRYDSGGVTFAIDGVDVANTPLAAGYTEDNAQVVGVGAYQATSFGITGFLRDALMIKRELTLSERALIVEELALGAGITLP